MIQSFVSKGFIGNFPIGLKSSKIPMFFLQIKIKGALSSVLFCHALSAFTFVMPWVEGRGQRTCRRIAVEG